jgi:hypothetical protein
MHLSKAGRRYGLLIKFTEDLFYPAFEVILVHYFDLFIGYLRSLVLQYFKYFYILFRGDSLESPYVLSSLEVDAATRCRQVEQPLGDPSVDLSSNQYKVYPYCLPHLDILVTRIGQGPQVVHVVINGIEH